MRRHLRLSARVAPILFVTTVFAQDPPPGPPERLEGHTVLSDSQFAALPATSADGEKFSIVYAKFNKQFNELLKLHASPLVDRLIVNDPALRQNLLADLDSTGKRRIPRRGNLQIIGTGRRTPEGVYTLLVSRVLVLESDLEHLRRRSAALARDDARSRTELVNYVEGRLRRYYQDPEADQAERRELVSLMRQLEEEVQTIELERLPALPGGAETHIEFGRRFKALNVLAQAWTHAEVSDEMRRRAEQVLTGELNAQRYLGRWYRHEDFKDLLNFERVADAWVPRERAEFLRACEGEKRRLRQNEPLQVLPDSLLQQAREVVKGMNKDMALQVLGGTYPARVDRVREQLGASTLVFEAWTMPSGQRIYFINGLVFQKVGD